MLTIFFAAFVDTLLCFFSMFPPPADQWNGVKPLAGMCITSPARQTKQDPLIKQLLYNGQKLHRVPLDLSWGHDHM